MLRVRAITGKTRSGRAPETTIPCANGRTASTSSCAMATPSAASVACGGRLAHPLDEPLRDSLAGHLVGQPLGFPQAAERADGDDERQVDLARPGPEMGHVGDVEDRLGHGELGPGLGLVAIAPDLLVEVERRRADADAGVERGRLADRLTAEVGAVIQPAHRVGDADRVRLDEHGRVGIVGPTGRLAGDEQDVAQPERVRAEQLGLHAGQAAVAAAELQHGFDAGLALEQQRGGERRHPGPAGRPIGDEQRVDAADPQLAAELDELLRRVAARRIELDGEHELAARQRAREARLLGPRHRLHDGRRHHGGHGRPGRAGPAAGRRRRGGDAHLARVIRRRAAAAADQAHAGGDEAPRVGRHVLRRREIDVAAFDVARPSGVRLHRRGAPSVRSAIRSIVSSIAAGPTLQFRPMTSAPSASSSAANCSGGVPSAVAPSSPVVICATIGRVRDGADAADGGAELGDVAEGLEHEQIDAALGERLGLLAERRFRFVEAGLAPRLDAHAERTDRAGDVGLAARRLAGDAHALRR